MSSSETCSYIDHSQDNLNCQSIYTIKTIYHFLHCEQCNTFTLCPRSFGFRICPFHDENPQNFHTNIVQETLWTQTSSWHIRKVMPNWHDDWPKIIAYIHTIIQLELDSQSTGVMADEKIRILPIYWCYGLKELKHVDACLTVNKIFRRSISYGFINYAK